MSERLVALQSRIRSLESVSAAIRAVHIKGLQCDDGPYDALALAEGWVNDGVFESSSARYEGKDAIRKFYRSLSAVFTMHYYTNLIITPGPLGETVDIDLYGFELPIINTRSAVGFFAHNVNCRVIKGKCLWVNWHQNVYVIAPFVEGWENGERIMNQSK